VKTKQSSRVVAVAGRQPTGWQPGQAGDPLEDDVRLLILVVSQTHQHNVSRVHPHLWG
jgi:hypothetical protein